jgi:transmembrane sensor
MTRPSHDSLDDKRLDEAIAWHARLNSSDTEGADWTEFTRWLEADAANRTAYDRVEDLQDELDDAAEMLAPQLVLKGEDGGGATIHELGGGRRRYRAAIATLGLIAASLVVAVGISRVQHPASETSYATATGERRTITLSDGTRIELNSGSTLIAMFGGTERHMRLDVGEAVFQVAADPSRPFVVTAGDRDIRDIGTVFDILRTAQHVKVTVAEGKVSVSPNGLTQTANEAAVQLSAGDQLVYREGAAADAVRRTDPATALAWREGYLVYEDAPLSEVIGDLNRYFPNRVALKDAAAGQRRFSGVLKIDSEDGIVRKLTEILPLVAERAQDGSISLRTKSSGE